MRPARPEDADDIARVHVRSWQVGYRGLLPDEYLDGLRPEERARRYQFDEHVAPHPMRIVALYHGKLVGFVNQGPCREDSAIGELYAIYVDPDHWSTGVGRRLIAESRLSLADQGFTEAVLWALEANERARHFYQADGWKADGGSKTEDVWGIRVNEVRYRRTLP